MNTQSISEAFNRVSKRRNNAISTYDRHVEEVEKNIPEIVYLNSQIANTSRNIIVSSLTKGIDIKSRIEEIKNANQRAQRRTIELLKLNGYPSDYLDIKYTCPKCSDTGYFNSDYCECILELISQINTENVNKNTKLKLCTFESFNLDYYSKSNLIDNENLSEYDNIKEIFSDCKDYVNGFDSNPKSILMIGGTGLGKTHLSLAIAREILEKGYNVIYNSAMDIFSAIEKEKFSKYNNNDNDTLDSILNTDLLIIDDLGIEYDNKFYKSVLYNIINTRYIRSLPTIINTNLSIDDLETKYDERIVSRLMVYQIMVFYGKDIRNKKEYQKKGYNSIDNKCR